MSKTVQKGEKGFWGSVVKLSCDHFVIILAHYSLQSKEIKKAYFIIVALVKSSQFL